MKYRLILLLFLVPLFLSNSIKQNKKENTEAADNWSGTVSWRKTSTSKGEKKWDDHGKENTHRWDFSFEFRINVNFINGKGTVVRADNTSKWEKDNIIFVHAENKYMIEERTTMISCNGQEVSDLSVEFSEDKKTYWISFSTPGCLEVFVKRSSNDFAFMDGLPPFDSCKCNPIFISLPLVNSLAPGSGIQLL